METDQIVAAILAAAQTAADGHNRADTYVTNYRAMLARLRDGAPEDGNQAGQHMPRATGVSAD